MFFILHTDSAEREILFIFIAAKTGRRLKADVGLYLRPA